MATETTLDVERLEVFSAGFSGSVVDPIAFAREAGLEISVRGGGHSVAGRAVTDGGLMIDLAEMKGIYVDPDARTVRAQGGVTWGEFNKETFLHGLATTGGVVSTTGIAGLTLGGGLGWLNGVYGLAVDNLLSVELVTADGQVLNVTEETHPDLFWALRGGGGNFGVASSGGAGPAALARVRLAGSDRGWPHALPRHEHPIGCSLPAGHVQLLEVE